MCRAGWSLLWTINRHPYYQLIHWGFPDLLLVSDFRCKLQHVCISQSERVRSKNAQASKGRNQEKFITSGQSSIQDHSPRLTKRRSQAMEIVSRQEKPLWLFWNFIMLRRLWRWSYFHLKDSERLQVSLESQVKYNSPKFCLLLGSPRSPFLGGCSTENLGGKFHRNRWKRLERDDFIGDVAPIQRSVCLFVSQNWSNWSALLVKCTCAHSDQVISMHGLVQGWPQKKWWNCLFAVWERFLNP